MTTDPVQELQQTNEQPCDPAGSKPVEIPAQNSRFGIKVKLLLALGMLAALTAVASAIAWSVFGDIERSVERVTQDSVPGMVASLRLATLSAEIAATAPAIVASTSQEERVLEQTRLDGRARAMAEQIEALKLSGASPEVTVALSDITSRIAGQLGQLSEAVERRLHAEAQRRESLARLSRAQTEFLEALEPLVDDAVFDLVISGEQATADGSRSITGLVEGGVSRLDQLLTINAEGNLAAGLLTESAQVGSPALLLPLRERFQATVAAIDRSLRHLPEASEVMELQQASEALIALGLGHENVFDLRARELRATSGVAGAGPIAHLQVASRLKAAHESFLLTVIPMIDNAAFNLVLSTEQTVHDNTAAIRDLIDSGVNSLYVLLTVRAEGNLAAGLLGAAAGTEHASLLQPLGERFLAAEGQITRTLAQLPAALDSEALRVAATILVDLGRGQDSVFAVRRDELAQRNFAESALDRSRELSVELGEEVAVLVLAARGQSDVAAADSAGSIQRGKLFMMILTASSLIGAAVVMVYYVVPRIVRPLNDISEAMTELARGDTSVDIPGRERRDELGRMAQALGVFRDTAIEVQRSNLQEIRETRRRLSDAIESISEAFSLYDPEDRLVVCNSKYRSLLYSDIADEIRPGMTFESIVRGAAERGYIKDAEGRIEEWLAERLHRHREPGGPHVQQRGDGRWIMVSERKTEDGGIVAVYSDITELKQREEELADKSSALEQLSNQLAKYLSPQVYESIFTGRQEVTLASRRKKLTVFFSDIAGFTETADRLESEDLTQLLNHYLTEMSQIALDHGATIDKYVGDAIVIFFGDPETKGVKEDALACVKMAIAMRKRMQELQGVWRESGIEKPLVCRIGINTGFCTVGNFGSEDRMDYTIIGGGVNLASRLETAATPGEILVSFETYAQVKDQILCEERGSVTVKGIAYPVETYQVRDSYEALGQAHQIIREDHPNLKLDLNLKAMSADEKGRAAKVLGHALDQLNSSNKPP